MSPTERRRVASFHSKDIHCAGFTGAGGYEDRVWLMHFEGDLKRMREPATRSELPGEVDAIVAFLKRKDGSGVAP